jgi:hypothetical protein
MCERCEHVAELVRSWASKQGHDVCWFYPEIFEEIAVALGVVFVPPNLPPRREFRSGCRIYEEQVYVGNGPVPNDSDDNQVGSCSTGS